MPLPFPVKQVPDGVSDQHQPGYKRYRYGDSQDDYLESHTHLQLIALNEGNPDSKLQAGGCFYNREIG